MQRHNHPRGCVPRPAPAAMGLQAVPQAIAVVVVLLASTSIPAAACSDDSAKLSALTDALLDDCAAAAAAGRCNAALFASEQVRAACPAACELCHEGQLYEPSSVLDAVYICGFATLSECENFVEAQCQVASLTSETALDYKDNKGAIYSVKARVLRVSETHLSLSGSLLYSGVPIPLSFSKSSFELTECTVARALIIEYSFSLFSYCDPDSKYCSVTVPTVIGTHAAISTGDMMVNREEDTEDNTLPPNTSAWFIVERTVLSNKYGVQLSSGSIFNEVLAVRTAAPNGTLAHQTLQMFISDLTEPGNYLLHIRIAKIRSSPLASFAIPEDGSMKAQPSKEISLDSTNLELVWLLNTARYLVKQEDIRPHPNRNNVFGVPFSMRVIQPDFVIAALAFYPAEVNVTSAGLDVQFLSCSDTLSEEGCLANSACRWNALLERCHNKEFDISCHAYPEHLCQQCEDPTNCPTFNCAYDRLLRACQSVRGCDCDRGTCRDDHFIPAEVKRLQADVYDVPPQVTEGCDLQPDHTDCRCTTDVDNSIMCTGGEDSFSISTSQAVGAEITGVYTRATVTFLRKHSGITDTCFYIAYYRHGWKPLLLAMFLYDETPYWALLESSKLEDLEEILNNDQEDTQEDRILLALSLAVWMTNSTAKTPLQLHNTAWRSSVTAAQMTTDVEIAFPLCPTAQNVAFLEEAPGQVRASWEPASDILQMTYNLGERKFVARCLAASGQDYQPPSSSVTVALPDVEDDSLTLDAVLELHPSTQYSCNIEAVGTRCSAAPSASIKILTAEQAPSLGASNLDVVTTATTARITWDLPPPEARHGNITEFLVELRRKPGQAGTVSTASLRETVQSRTMAVDSRAVMLSGLEEYIEYEVRINAKTSAGRSAVQNFALFQTKAAAPSAAPQNLVVSQRLESEAVIRFDPPTLSEQNGPILRHAVEVVAIPSLDVLATVDFSFAVQQQVARVGSDDEASQQVLLQDLETEQLYAVRIAAVNEAGQGPASDPIAVGIFDPTTAAAQSSSSSSTGTMIGGVVAGVLALLLLIGFFLYRRATREPPPLNFEQQLDKMRREGLINEQMDVKLLPKEIPRSQIKLLEHLGKGSFGLVQKAVYRPSTTSTRGLSEFTVAVKVLKDLDAKQELLDEATIMAQIAHDNVVGLVGVVTRGMPWMLILQYCENGALDEFLRKQTKVASTRLVNRINMARDVAAGMKYIASLGLVHCDLAARNVLLAADFTCKVADFGLSKTFNAELYFVGTQAKMPVRWTAVEVLQASSEGRELRYTSKADVWSFGVLLWEIFSNAALPYPDIKAGNEQAVIDRVIAGQRLECPPNCPADYFKIMTICWATDKTCRPDFSYLHELFCKHYEMLEKRDEVAPQIALDESLPSGGYIDFTSEDFRYVPGQPLREEPAVPAPTPPAAATTTAGGSVYHLAAQGPPSKASMAFQRNPAFDPEPSQASGYVEPNIHVSTPTRGSRAGPTSSKSSLSSRFSGALGKGRRSLRQKTKVYSLESAEIDETILSGNKELMALRGIDSETSRL
eukprot:m.41498 g.41498  ORF g.41498 m.41498 type:complete len:1538 (+) comp6047_c0_seq1:3-4616(+)